MSRVGIPTLWVYECIVRKMRKKTPQLQIQPQTTNELRRYSIQHQMYSIQQNSEKMLIVHPYRLYNTQLFTI